MIPLHNHSEFSALDGLASCDEIAERLIEANLPGAFLTDHGVVAGWRPFHKALTSRGLFAGFGIEAYQARTNRAEHHTDLGKRDQNHLILVAKNDIGLKNIMLLNYEANEGGFYYVPRIDWELLEKYHEGVICTSACVLGLTAKGVVDDDLTIISKYQKIFGDDFFIELHTYTPDKVMKDIGASKTDTTQRQVNEALVSIATERGIPMVYANDAHYACMDEHHFHEALLAAQMNFSLEDPNRMSHAEPCLYIMDEMAVRSALDYLPKKVVNEAIKNSDFIAGSCGVTLPEPGKHLPVYIPDFKTEESNNEIILRLAEEGAVRIYGNDYPEAVEDRMVSELRTIINAGLADYFLITKDFCDFADSAGIGRGPGRGSVGGSLVAYLLGITGVDPLKYDLYFERFYNEGRDEGLPDIDIDFNSKRRGEIDEYLKKRWGANNVFPIGNHIRLAPVAALQKMAKPFGIPYGDVEAIKDIVKDVPDIGIISGDQIGWLYDPKYKITILEEMNNEGKVVPTEFAHKLSPFLQMYTDYFDAVFKVTGRISTYGVHASAVIISDVDVRGILPIMNRSEDEKGNKSRVLATQVEMREVEAMGFPKFDRLSLENLGVIEDAENLAGVKIDWSSINWEEMPEEMWTLIERNFTLGIFQVEDGNAKRIGKTLKPRNIEDCAAIVALNRPGPLRSGSVERFLACRLGEAEPNSYHPIVDKILEPTYGEFLYQEQVIRYFSAIGYDPKEADGIRKILGKKLAVKMLEEKPRYLERASKVMDLETANVIWEDIVSFSLYSFNKSHAIAYGMVLARTLYMKYFHSTAFYMSCVKHAKDKERQGAFINEARRAEIKINPPDINRSDINMVIADDEIYIGLTEVKNVGIEPARWIINHRPYEDLEHFMERRKASQKAWEDSGKVGKSANQQIRQNAIDSLYLVGAFDSTNPRELTDPERADLELEYLGVALTNPIQAIIDYHDLGNMPDFVDLDDESLMGQFVTVAGTVSNVRITKTKNGKNPGQEMGFFTLNWNYDKLDVVSFPNTWASYKGWLLGEGNFGVFEIRLNPRGPQLEWGKRLTETRAISVRTEQGDRAGVG